MLRILHSSYATERIAAATEFIQSFAVGTEQLIVGASREAADDLVRGIAFARGATFGWHRLSLIQLAARLASPRLAEKGLAPGTSIGNDALAARAVYEELEQRRLKYFEVVAQFPGFAHATASTLSDLRLGGVRAEDMRLTETSVQDVSALLGQYDKQCVAAAIADRVALLRLAAEAVRTDRPEAHETEFAAAHPHMPNATFYYPLVIVEGNLLTAHLLGAELCVTPADQVLVSIHYRSSRYPGDERHSVMVVRESALPVAIEQLDDWLKTCTENFKTQPSCFTPVAAETKIVAKKTETASSAQRPPSRRARKRRSRWADWPEAADRK